VDDFDASSLGVTFNLVFAHSVMSHFAHWQMDVFLRNTSKVLAPGGKIIASMALAEGNVYGNPGTPDKQDSMDEKWVYPGSSFFRLATVEKTAATLGLTVTNVQEYTAFITATQQDHCHDWLVFQRAADV
jgi:cyclopropane fatty-acyl-phospholipid synthase-like methyltransferase